MGKLFGAYQLTRQAQANWLGVTTVVDALRSNEVRRRLNVRSLLHVRDL